MTNFSAQFCQNISPPGMRHRHNPHAQSKSPFLEFSENSPCLPSLPLLKQNTGTNQLKLRRNGQPGAKCSVPALPTCLPTSWGEGGWDRPLRRGLLHLRRLPAGQSWGDRSPAPSSPVALSPVVPSPLPPIPILPPSLPPLRPPSPRVQGSTLNRQWRLPNPFTRYVPRPGRPA